MRRFLYVAGVLDVTWVLISLGGIITDPDALSFWSQNLMGGLLLAVFIAPALVFSRSDDRATPSSSPEKVRVPRSPARIATYALSGLLTLWLFVSLFGLFLQSDQVAFWGQSLMWSFIATILVAPLLVFVVNPFQDPVLVEETDDEPAEPFITDEAHTSPFSTSASEPGVPASPTSEAAPTREDAAHDADAYGADVEDANVEDADTRQGWPWNVAETADETVYAAEGESRPVPEPDPVEDVEAVKEMETAEEVAEADVSVDPASPGTSSPDASAKTSPGEFRVRPPAADAGADEAWPAWPDDEGR